MKNLPKICLISGINATNEKSTEAAQTYRNLLSYLQNRLSASFDLSIAKTIDDLQNSHDLQSISAIIFISQAMVAAAIRLSFEPNFRDMKIIVLCGYLGPEIPDVKESEGVFLVKKNVGNFMENLQRTILS